jgi:hypothetical protein
MSLDRKQLVRDYKALFKVLRPSVVRWVDCSADWYGFFMPGTRSDTIILNLDLVNTDDLIRGILLHELIHSEQHTLGLPLHHGRWFTRRRHQLERITGVSIHDGSPQ